MASDGKWYPPELHPFAPTSSSTPGAPGSPSATNNPWGYPQQHIYGQQTAFSAGGGPGVPWVPEQQRSPRARPAVIAITVVVVLALLSIAAPAVGHVVRELSKDTASVPSADQIPVTSTPPTSLAGQELNTQGLDENADWSALVSQVEKASTVSFGAVYGPYPPTELPTTQTFMVVAAEPTGGIGDIPNEVSTQVSGVKTAMGNYPGAQFATLSARPSVFDGQIECVSVTITNGVVGLCLWMNAVDLVELVTFSGDLIAVSSMSTQVITELQDHSTTA